MSSPQTVVVSFELALGDVVLAQQPRVSHATVQITPALPPVPPTKDVPVVVALRHLLGLTQNEARALARLLEHGHATKEQIHAATSIAGAPMTKLKGVDVLIHKIRRKLILHNIEITTVHGQGFRIDESSRRKVKKLIAGYGDIPTQTNPPQQVSNG
jgi:hypothetical protein